MSALAGKCQQKLMAAIFALHACKSVMQIAAVPIPINDLLNIGTEKSIQSFKTGDAAVPPRGGGGSASWVSFGRKSTRRL
jgi:hypothetical protein